ncbi:hypothetical protein BB561_006307 [Smittium simulii]|uniref:Conserved oligomeric Golgi complex subunit 5 helical domain-containing protein n=1 Tax=Smittium simulii TaxID=133385 RepID=A0A2T9Y557_9FUNG|nr:hypothetical protein BB561_006307 [Smittium simulii]
MQHSPQKLKDFDSDLCEFLSPNFSPVAYISKNVFLKKSEPSNFSNETIISLFQKLDNLNIQSINSTQTPLQSSLSQNKLELLTHCAQINTLEDIVFDSKSYISEVKNQIQKLQWQIKFPLEQMEDRLNSVTNLKASLESVRFLNKFVLLVQKLTENFSISNPQLDLFSNSLITNFNDSSNLFMDSESIHHFLTFFSSLIADITHLSMQPELKNILVVQNLINTYVLPRQKLLEFYATQIIKIGINSQKILYLGIGLQVFFNFDLLSNKGKELITEVINETIFKIENKIDYNTLQNLILDLVNIISNAIQKINTIEKVFLSNKFVKKASSITQPNGGQIVIFDFISSNASFLNNQTIVGYWWFKVAHFLDLEVYRAKLFPVLWSMFLSLYPRFIQLIDSSTRQVFGDHSKNIIYDSILLDARKDYNNQVKNRLDILSRKFLLYWKPDEYNLNNETGFALSEYIDDKNLNVLNILKFFNPILTNRRETDKKDTIQNILSPIYTRDSKLTDFLDAKVLNLVLKGIQNEFEMVSLFEPLLLEITQVSIKLIVNIHNEIVLRIVLSLDKLNTLYTKIRLNNFIDDDYIKISELHQTVIEYNNFLVDLSNGLVSIGWGNLVIFNNSKMITNNLNITSATKRESKNLSLRTEFTKNRKIGAKKWESIEFLSNIKISINFLMCTVSNVVHILFESASSLISLKIGDIVSNYAQSALDNSHYQDNSVSEKNSTRFEILTDITKSVFNTLTFDIIKKSKSISVPPMSLFFICSLMKTFVSFGCLTFPSTEESNLQLVSFASNLEFECSQMLNSISTIDKNLLCCIQIDNSNNDILISNDYNDLKYILFSQGLSGSEESEIINLDQNYTTLKLTQLGKPYFSLRSFKQMIFLSNESLGNSTKEFIKQFIVKNDADEGLIKLKKTNLVTNIESAHPFIKDLNKFDTINNIISRLITLLKSCMINPQQIKPISVTSKINSSINSHESLNLRICELLKKIINKWLSLGFTVNNANLNSGLIKEKFLFKTKNLESSDYFYTKKFNFKELNHDNKIDGLDLIDFVNFLVFSSDTPQITLTKKLLDFMKEKTINIIQLLDIELCNYFDFEMTDIEIIQIHKKTIGFSGPETVEFNKIQQLILEKYNLDYESLISLGHFGYILASLAEK